MKVAKYYYELTKSGLVFGNLITVIAGFLLGARDTQGETAVATLSVNIWLLIATVIGIGLVMASGCVFNNYIDRDIDGKMERTKRRALIKGSITPRNAVIFASVLGVVGFLLLMIFSGFLAALVAAVGFVFYVFFYSMWGKRRSEYGTIIGAVAGATPPVVGYAAASGRVDLAALILFLIMLTWQMPHFFAIAIRRREDYAAAKIPVMPVRHGIHRTKFSMAIYIAEFMVATSLLLVFGYMGPVYFSIVLLTGIVWLGFSMRGFVIPDGHAIHRGVHDSSANLRWARQMFLVSLVVMLIVFSTIGVLAVVG